MSEFASGKGAGDENFPVASLLIQRRHRAPILAFYALARRADDIADHPTATPARKLAALDAVEAELGEGDAHLRDLLAAFRRDVTQNRYADWADLMAYCRLSAAPVGRFVLDVHGEDHACWPASDALCAALQVINHLQDCGKDYRALDRVYLPADALARHGASVEMLGEAQAAAPLRAAIVDLAGQTRSLLDQARPLAAQVRDRRLALEIAAIRAIAERLVGLLERRDPLSQRVRLSRLQALGTVVRAAAARPARRQPRSEASQASGSSFYSAMRILPRARREAMFAIYGFCRAVDDIADAPHADPLEQRAGLESWREAVRGVFTGQCDERTAALAPHLARFGLKEADFQAIIDGMEMDVGAPIVAPGFAALDLYCDRVASAVGRLSERVFGESGETGPLVAHHLGRALQFTNILRDLDEDAALGRLYLPAEALAVAGVEPREPAAVLADPGLDVACRWLARKAHAHYEAADRLMADQRRAVRRAPRLMAAVYGAILCAMEAQGWAAPRRRVSLGKRRLAALALRALLLA